MPVKRQFFFYNPRVQKIKSLSGESFSYNLVSKILRLKRKCNRTLTKKETKEAFKLNTDTKLDNLMLDPMDMTMDVYEVNDLKEWWDTDLEVSVKISNIFQFSSPSGDD